MDSPQLLLRQVATGLAALSLLLVCICAASTFGGPDEIDAIPWATFEMAQGPLFYCGANPPTPSIAAAAKPVAVSLGGREMVLTCGSKQTSVAMDRASCSPAEEDTLPGISEFCSACGDAEDAIFDASIVSVAAHVVGLGAAMARLPWRKNGGVLRWICAVVTLVGIAVNSAVLHIWRIECFTKIDDTTPRSEPTEGAAFWLSVAAIAVDVALFLIHAGATHNDGGPWAAGTPCELFMGGRSQSFDLNAARASAPASSKPGEKTAPSITRKSSDEGNSRHRHISKIRPYNSGLTAIGGSSTRSRQGSGAGSKHTMQGASDPPPSEAGREPRVDDNAIAAAPAAEQRLSAAGSAAAATAAPAAEPRLSVAESATAAAVAAPVAAAAAPAAEERLSGAGSATPIATGLQSTERTHGDEGPTIVHTEV